MKISVNLATRPFVELRPFFLRLRVLMGALALAAIALMLTAHLLADQTKTKLKITRNMSTGDATIEVPAQAPDPMDTVVDLQL